MKNTILAAVALLISVGVTAQKQFSVTIVDNKRIVTGMEEFNVPAQNIFANAFLWAIDEGPNAKEEILDYDFQKMRFAMVYNLKKENSVAYSCRLQVQVSDNQLVFTVQEVKIQGGLMGLFANFDKLNPEKKPKHADIIHDFERLNNKKLDELFKFISSHKLQLTNWSKVVSGSIERGMSPDEVILVYGKPLSIQNSGDVTQYVYGNFVHIFVEDGKVKSFIN